LPTSRRFECPCLQLLQAFRVRFLAPSLVSSIQGPSRGIQVRTSLCHLCALPSEDLGAARRKVVPCVEHYSTLFSLIRVCLRCLSRMMPSQVVRVRLVVSSFQRFFQETSQGSRPRELLCKVISCSAPLFQTARFEVVSGAKQLSAASSLTRVAVFHVGLGLSCQRRLKADGDDVPTLRIRVAKRAIDIGIVSRVHVRLRAYADVLGYRESNMVAELVFRSVAKRAFMIRRCVPCL